LFWEGRSPFFSLLFASIHTSAIYYTVDDVYQIGFQYTLCTAHFAPRLRGNSVPLLTLRTHTRLAPIHRLLCYKTFKRQFDSYRASSRESFLSPLSSFFLFSSQRCACHCRSQWQNSASSCQSIDVSHRKKKVIPKLWLVVLVDISGEHLQHKAKKSWNSPGSSSREGESFFYLVFYSAHNNHSKSRSPYRGLCILLWAYLSSCILFSYWVVPHYLLFVAYLIFCIQIFNLHTAVRCFSTLFMTIEEKNIRSQFLCTGKQTIYTQFYERSEERRVGKECRSRWSPYH